MTCDPLGCARSLNTIKTNNTNNWDSKVVSCSEDEHLMMQLYARRILKVGFSGSSLFLAL